MKNEKKQVSLSKKVIEKRAKMRKKLIIIAVLLAIIVVSLVVTYFVQSAKNKFSKPDFSVADAQKIIDSEFDEQIEDPSVYNAIKYDKEHVYVKAEKILELGNKRNVLVECSYQTYNYGEVLSENLDEMYEQAWLYRKNTKNEKEMSASELDIKRNFKLIVEDTISECRPISGTIVMEIYEISPGHFTVNKSDEVVNKIFGGVLDVISAAKTYGDNTEAVTIDGDKVDFSKFNTLRNGIAGCFCLKEGYDNTIPDTNIPLIRSWNTMKNDFYRNFVENDRFMYLVRGLGVTLALTACAVLLGIILGFLVAVVRVTNQKTGKLDILSDICKIYLSIMRGTPVMVQLLIIYFVILLPLGVEKFIAAVLCFGLNSGAYVSEIIRGGIMSVDDGQTEAGRSLGFTYIQTMFHIVIPQAFKAVLPSLANEFITLLKESSVAFYIGVADLTLGGIKIRSVTYSNFMPLIAVAIIYLVVVLALSKCVNILERRLSKGDKR